LSSRPNHQENNQEKDGQEIADPLKHENGEEQNENGKGHLFPSAAGIEKGAVWVGRKDFLAWTSTTQERRMMRIPNDKGKKPEPGWMRLPIS